MYFHGGVSEFILFKDFVPQNETQYVQVCFLIFFIAIVYEALQYQISLWETKIKRQNRWDSPRMGNESSPLLDTAQVVQPSTNGKIYRAAVRSGFRSLSVLLAYLLMLLAMSFNIGIFTCIILGFAVGNFIFCYKSDTNYHLDGEHCH